ncbi:hypothetical protein ABZZ36_41915, partial [Actinacidiphila glaucinigra]
MNARTRSALAALLALSAVAFPVAQTAVATPPPSPSTCTSTVHTGGLDTEALCTALGSLPDSDTTAALVRVGGTDGTWRGSAGVHDLGTGRPADPQGRFRAGPVTKVFTVFCRGSPGLQPREESAPERLGVKRPDLAA